MHNPSLESYIYKNKREIAERAIVFGIHDIADIQYIWNRYLKSSEIGTSLLSKEGVPNV